MPSEHSDTEYDRAVDLMRRARNVVVFSGAGISVESGIATFRDEGGFWQEFPPHQFANWSGLLQLAVAEPRRLADFLLAVLGPIARAEPNAAHRAVARLQIQRPTRVITQNVDALHQAAGSTGVLEIHGSLFRVCGLSGSSTRWELTRDDLLRLVAEIESARAARWPGLALLRAVRPLLGFSSRGLHRPAVVLFGDALAEPAWSEAQSAVAECDLLLAVGTSQTVFPAALLVEDARQNGARVIVVDPQSGGGDLWLRGRATDILPQLIEDVANDRLPP